ncbi:hypothetical protein, partial [Xanthovirga aplysinae]|uniref:hypothetical protein n=1 Tax=Xanthovirga aplysinae TaxID=2529853 RepID=UPI001656E161
PAIGFLSGFFLGRGTRGEYDFRPQVNFTFAHTIGKKMNWGANIGTVFPKGADITHRYTFMVKYNATKFVSPFLETFGTFRYGVENSYFIHPGATFVLNKYIKPGLSVHKSLNTDEKMVFNAIMYISVPTKSKNG